MRLILAVEPDHKQAARVEALAAGLRGTDVITVDSAVRALDFLAHHTPDLILTSMLLSPREETALVDRLRELDAVGTHVQSLVIPVLGTAKRPKNGTGLFSKLRRQKPEVAVSDGCDPSVFAAQIEEYLERAALERLAAAERHEPLYPGYEPPPPLPVQDPVAVPASDDSPDDDPAPDYGTRLLLEELDSESGSWAQPIPSDEGFSQGESDGWGSVEAADAPDEPVVTQSDSDGRDDSEPLFASTFDDHRDVATVSEPLKSDDEPIVVQSDALGHVTREQLVYPAAPEEGPREVVASAPVAEEPIAEESTVAPADAAEHVADGVDEPLFYAPEVVDNSGHVVTPAPSDSAVPEHWADEPEPLVYPAAHEETPREIAASELVAEEPIAGEPIVAHADTAEHVADGVDEPLIHSSDLLNDSGNVTTGSLDTAAGSWPDETSFVHQPVVYGFQQDENDEAAHADSESAAEASEETSVLFVDDHDLSEAQEQSDVDLGLDLSSFIDPESNDEPIEDALSIVEIDVDPDDSALVELAEALEPAPGGLPSDSSKSPSVELDADPLEEFGAGSAWEDAISPAASTSPSIEKAPDADVLIPDTTTSSAEHHPEATPSTRSSHALDLEIPSLVAEPGLAFGFEPRIVLTDAPDLQIQSLMREPATSPPPATIVPPEPGPVVTDPPQSVPTLPGQLEVLEMLSAIRRDLEQLRVERNVETAPPPPAAAKTAAKTTEEPKNPDVEAGSPEVSDALAETRADTGSAVPPPTIKHPQAAQTAKLAPTPKRKKRKKQAPVQDEWGFFDPEQCGFAALLEKLEEITEEQSNDQGSD